MFISYVSLSGGAGGYVHSKMQLFSCKLSSSSSPPPLLPPPPPYSGFLLYQAGHVCFGGCFYTLFGVLFIGLEMVEIVVLILSRLAADLILILSRSYLILS